ncbi:L,D-transpeptidase family protein [Bacillus sp. T3]|uniref:L,D-transpeptidase family protein n=1 Tax=Bacillus sp. T3 TaxID=467262 RepID=UPI0029821F3C|nr:L,D-transpeptidase family protein [Bacillus sp. T3]
MIHTVTHGETLAIIAKNYRKSLQALLAANPSIHHPYNLTIGQRINIPGIPDPATIPFQIIVSLRKRTLTLFQSGRIRKTYPIAIGKMLTQTPPGKFIIVNRQPNPGGPFGVLWLSLSKSGYGIHGTNNPASIGKAVSHGCIRMYNHDVLELASIVPNGTTVIITT